MTSPPSVRVTHWLTVLAFFALLLSGVNILVSHPRFYWGDTGNSRTKPLLQFPIPASRASVPTGYDFVLPDQNGWSRALHFQAAWLLVFTGLFYVLASLIGGHFRRALWPSSGELSARELGRAIADHLRLQPPRMRKYNVLQKIAYLKVIFLLAPLTIWTGLAMSPAFTAAFPATVTLLGGHQSARTLHFLCAVALFVFFVMHLIMIWRVGFVERTRAMLTGRAATTEEPA